MLFSKSDNQQLLKKNERSLKQFLLLELFEVFQFIMNLLDLLLIGLRENS